MTVQEGMDPKVIRGVARDVGRQAETLEGIGQAGRAMVGTLSQVWSGDDLDAFLKEWDDVSPRIAGAAGALRTAGQDLLQQAGDQVEASGGSGSGGGGGGGGGGGWGWPKLPKIDLKVPGVVDDLFDAGKDVWNKAKNVWDDATGAVGEWLDDKGAGVRKWLGEHANILRGFQKVANVVGPVLMAAGGILIVAGAFTGPGEVVLGPLGGALMTAGGIVWGAGDAAGLLADWGEGKIDGQDLVQQGIATAAISAIPFGIGKLGKAGWKFGKHADDVDLPGGSPGHPPKIDGPPASSYDDISDIPHTKGSQEWADEVHRRHPEVSPEGAKGIHDYTTNEGYDAMNGGLRSSEGPSPEVQKRVEATDRGLEELPPKPGTTYRGTDLPEDVLADYQVGETVSDRAYTSSSSSHAEAEHFRKGGNAEIEIEGKSGRDVTSFSEYPKESEVLFPRDTEFEVVSRERMPDGHYKIKLREK